MAMYYFLRQNLHGEGTTLEISGHNDETGAYLWTAGHKFENASFSKALILESEYGEEHSDFYSSSVPVMSKKLLDLMLDMGVDNIDFYPVVLKHDKTDEEFVDYFAVNIIGRIDAVDHVNSIGKKRPGRKRLRYSKLVIDESKTMGGACFRLLDVPNHIVISEAVAKYLMGEKLSDVLIQPLSEFAGF